jgi:hypothetical protein
MCEKKIGKLKLVAEEKNGSGTYITLNEEELKKFGVRVGDWIKFIEEDEGAPIEKASIEEVTRYLDDV